MSTVVVTAPCPSCADALEAQATDQGIVWVCRTCRGCVANLAVIRKVAPAKFAKYLWLAAVESGVPSPYRCPSCGQPLLDFGADVELTPACRVCCRCFLLWFDRDALSLATSGPRTVGARRGVLALAFGAVRRVGHVLNGALR